MWYGSNLAWGSQQADMQHVIKYASSRDGLAWRRSGDVAVPLLHQGEYALSKPHVVREIGGWRMWYSYRGHGAVETYRIGCAVSPDGELWERRDARHQRRYGRTELQRKLEAAGFRVRFSTSIVVLLLPLLYASRAFARRDATYDPRAEFRAARWVEATLYGVMRIEGFLIRHALRFPVGGTRLVLAEKPA